MVGLTPEGMTGGTLRGSVVTMARARIRSLPPT